MYAELKVKYAGKCSGCGRDIKENWNVWYDKDTKKMLCKPCYSALLPPAQQAVHQPSQVPEYVPPNEIEIIQNRLTVIENSLFDLQKSLSEQIAGIAHTMEFLNSNLVTLAVRDAPRPEAKKVAK